MSTDTSSVLSGGVYICWKLLAVFFHNFCIYLYFVHSLSHYLSVQAQIANPLECDWKCGFCKWNYWLCGSWLVESSSGIQYKYWEKAILESLSGCTVNLMWLRTFLKTGLLEIKNYISELYGFLRILSSCINPILIFGCDFKITLLNTTGLYLPRRSREMSCTDIKGKVHWKSCLGPHPN